MDLQKLELVVAYAEQRAQERAEHERKAEKARKEEAQKRAEEAKAKAEAEAKAKEEAKAKAEKAKSKVREEAWLCRMEVRWGEVFLQDLSRQGEARQKIVAATEAAAYRGDAIQARKGLEYLRGLEPLEPIREQIRAAIEDAKDALIPLEDKILRLDGEKLPTEGEKVLIEHAFPKGRVVGSSVVFPSGRTENWQRVLGWARAEAKDKEAKEAKKSGTVGAILEAKNASTGASWAPKPVLRVPEHARHLGGPTKGAHAPKKAKKPEPKKQGKGKKQSRRAAGF